MHATPHLNSVETHCHLPAWMIRVRCMFSSSAQLLSHVMNCGSGTAPSPSCTLQERTALRAMLAMSLFTRRKAPMSAIRVRAVCRQLSSMKGTLMKTIDKATHSVERVVVGTSALSQRSVPIQFPMQSPVDGGFRARLHYVVRWISVHMVHTIIPPQNECWRSALAVIHILSHCVVFEINCKYACKEPCIMWHHVSRSKFLTISQTNSNSKLLSADTVHQVEWCARIKFTATTWVRMNSFRICSPQDEALVDHDTPRRHYLVKCSQGWEYRCKQHRVFCHALRMLELLWSYRQDLKGQSGKIWL